MIPGWFRFCCLSAMVLLAGGCGSRSAGGVGVEDSGHIFTINLSDSLLRSDTPDTLHLGRMSRGEIISQSVGLKNATSAPVVIMGVETTCGCTTVEYPKRPIAPGQTETMTFKFDSKGEYGRQFKAFYILTSINTLRHRIYLTGEVD